MTVAALKPRNAVESLRDIVPDLLVPELKALKVEMAANRDSMKIETTAIRSEITSLRGEVVTGLEAVRVEMRLRDEKQSQAIQALSEKLSYAIDIRERLAVLEDRSARA